MENSEKFLTLSSRKKDILLKSVESYISDGVPVSSNSLIENHGLTISSASIRNELNTLEELGFLKKLHTSGGRVPTTLGYKAFVQSLTSALPRNAKMLKQIKETFLNRSHYLSETIKKVAKVVSDVTNYPAVVLMSGLKNFTIEKIQIVPLLSSQAFVLIQTNAGILDPIVLENSDISETSCLEAGAILTRNFKGLKISDLVNSAEKASGQISQDLKNYETIFKGVVHIVNEYIKSTEKAYSVGATNLLELPECETKEDAKRIIDLIEDEEKLSEILDPEDEEKGIKFKFGASTSNEDVAIVKTNCSLGGINLAQVAVIGPERMDYSKIASALLFISKEFESMEKGDSQASGEEE